MEENATTYNRNAKPFIEQYNVQIEEKWFDIRAGGTTKFNPLDCINVYKTNDEIWRMIEMKIKNYNDLKEELDIWILVFLNHNMLTVGRKDLDNTKDITKKRTNRAVVKDMFYKKAYSMLKLDPSRREGLSDAEMEFVVDHMEEIFQEIQRELFRIAPLFPISFKKMVEDYKKLLLKGSADLPMV